MSPKFDVCTFGSITVDLFLQPKEMKEMKMYSPGKQQTYFLLREGEKMQIKNSVRTVGGGAANASVGLSRLGFSAAAFGVIGTDENGNFIKNMLKKNKVNTDFCTEKRGGSSFSVIITSFRGDRTVLHQRTTHRDFGENTILNAPACRAIYVSHLYDKAQKILFEIPEWKARSKRQGALQKQRLVFWTPGKTQFRTGFDAFKFLFPHIDYLILNREEAESFTKISSREIQYAKAPPSLIGEKVDIFAPEYAQKTIGDVREIAKKFLAAGVENIIITDGRKGAQLFNKKEHLFVPTFAEPPFCTLGAGDGFAVGVMGARLRGEGFRTQLCWGHKNAAAVVEQFGAEGGLLTLEQIENMS